MEVHDWGWSPWSHLECGPLVNYIKIHHVWRCQEPSWRMTTLCWSLGGCERSWPGLWSSSLIKIWPPLNQKSIFGQKGGQKPKISPKLNQVGLSSNFQGSSCQANDQGWWWKIWLSLSQKMIFGQKGGQKLKISPKLNQVGLSSKFQGSSGPTNDHGWWWEFLPPIS